MVNTNNTPKRKGKQFWTLTIAVLTFLALAVVGSSMVKAQLLQAEQQREVKELAIDALGYVEYSKSRDSLYVTEGYNKTAMQRTLQAHNASAYFINEQEQTVIWPHDISASNAKQALETSQAALSQVKPDTNSIEPVTTIIGDQYHQAVALMRFETDETPNKKRLKFLFVVARPFL